MCVCVCGDVDICAFLMCVFMFLLLLCQSSRSVRLTERMEGAGRTPTFYSSVELLPTPRTWLSGRFTLSLSLSLSRLVFCPFLVVFLHLFASWTLKRSSFFLVL